MWPVDERLRMEQELLRSSHDGGIQGGAAVREQAHPAPIHPHLMRQQQLAMLQQQMHNSSSGQAMDSSASNLLPPLNDVAMMDRHALQAATSGFQFQGSASDASSRLHVLRLMRLREERQLLEERHALMKQQEDLQLQQILKQRSVPNQHHAEGAAGVATTAGSVALPQQASKTIMPTNTGTASHIAASPNDPGFNEQVTGVAVVDENKKKNSATSPSPQEGNEPSVNASKNVKAPKVSFTNTDKPKVSKKKDVRWYSTLEELKEYKQLYGDCIVPRGMLIGMRVVFHTVFFILTVY